jgi:glycogen phosphorylase
MNARSIAYFSMEVALDPAMPTYAGGLGILAGDTIRSAADLAVPMVAVSLLHRKGYLKQQIDVSGWQHEEPTEWPVEKCLQEMPQRVKIIIQRRAVIVRAWKYDVKGFSDSTVPVFLLDTDLPENSEWDRTLTHYLYGGDRLYRLCQEVVLGIGGVRMLRALGFQHLARFHMNEGHAALLTLELLSELSKQAGRAGANQDDIAAVRERCIFTTHTPVPAGHDQFPMELLADVLGHRDDFLDMRDLLCVDLVNEVFGRSQEFSDFKGVLQSGNALNMTYLALNLSHYVNGVAKRHAEISHLMFARHKIDAITNGVHVTTWLSEPFRKLFDKYIPGWEADNFSLRFAQSIPRAEIWTAHVEAKRQLFDYVKQQTGIALDENVLTIGFARRSAAYKRANLIFHDVGRLKSICQSVGRIQLLFAGKAHGNDHEGKELIQRILQQRDLLKNDVPIVYLTNYDIVMAKLITSGVDVWLNTPQPPMEASGTSGMKAALNGVPSLSILDGWWIEGCIEGETGWAIGERQNGENGNDERSAKDGAALYNKLERTVIPLYYTNRDRFMDVMRHAISLNGSFFNTQRMVQQYVVKAYFE